MWRTITASFNWNQLRFSNKNSQSRNRRWKVKFYLNFPQPTTSSIKISPKVRKEEWQQWVVYRILLETHKIIKGKKQVYILTKWNDICHISWKKCLSSFSHLWIHFHLKDTLLSCHTIVEFSFTYLNDDYGNSSNCTYFCIIFVI